ADLRGAHARYATFGLLSGANLDNLDGQNVYITDAEDCTFRGADLTKLWGFWGSGKTLARCDFTGAKMTAGRLSKSGGAGAVTNCAFAKTDLTDAEAEGTSFTGCDFSGANLTRLRAHKATFADARFIGANLFRADLRDTALRGADLTGADLREAALGGADLTDAKVAGADFAGALLTGATLLGVDFAEAKNFTPPAARVAGPKLTEFEAACAGAKNFSTSAQVDFEGDEKAVCAVRIDKHGARAFARYYRSGDDVQLWITGTTLSRMLLNTADRWPGGTLRLDTVEAKGAPKARGAKLKALAVAAWAEAFGVPLDSGDALAREQHAEALRQRGELLARMRKDGAGVWNGLDFRQRRLINMRGADLSGASLESLDLVGYDLRGANFAGAFLLYSKLWGTDFGGADFTGACLRGAQLDGCKCEKATFAGAVMPGAVMRGARLQGADLTGADLTGTDLAGAQFDHETKFPAGFAIPENMVWKGD
ncbi:MAG: pentapeptide repeat-containing protein, partial [Gemmataceae bacterium]|nr:pentapeptide repeat-containing protein [Gemmataceae bacterium]